MAELVDAHDSGSCGISLEGSSPFFDIFKQKGVCIVQVNKVSGYNLNFTGKGQKYIQEGRTLIPIPKVSAQNSPEPPKTFLGKVGHFLKHIIDRLYYYCFCAK